MTDPGNPGQPYGGQPYGGQPGQPHGGGHYGPSDESSGGPYGPPQPTSPHGGGEAPVPYPGGPVPPAPFPGAPVPPPPKKGGAGKVIGIIAGVVVLLLVICIGVALAGGNKLLDSIKNDPANAKVGNCLAGETMDSTTAKPVNNIKIVDCGATDAKYKVVGVVSGKTEAQFNTDDKICSSYSTAESALWQGTSGKAGSVLCLEPVKK